MRASHSEIERLALNELEPQLIRRGYQLIRNPSKAELPSFIQGYVPDAIATGKVPNIAIEIKGREAPEAEPSLSRVRKLFEGHDDWIFKVYYFNTLEPLIMKIPAGELSDRLEKVEGLAEINTQAAFVLAWSVLEASVRENDMLDDGPRGPNRLVSLLASEGYLKRGDVTEFLELANLRNKIVHGQLDIEPTVDDVKRVLSLASTVRETDAGQAVI